MEFDHEKLAASKAALPERNRRHQEQKAAWRMGETSAREPRNVNAESLGAAIQRGAILSEPVKAPGPLDRYKERAAVKRYEKQVNAASLMIAGEVPAPASVERKRERETLKRSNTPRW